MNAKKFFLRSISQWLTLFSNWEEGDEVVESTLPVFFLLIFCDRDPNTNQPQQFGKTNGGKQKRLVIDLISHIFICWTQKALHVSQATKKKGRKNGCPFFTAHKHN